MKTNLQINIPDRLMTDASKAQMQAFAAQLVGDLKTFEANMARIRSERTVSTAPATGLIKRLRSGDNPVAGAPYFGHQIDVMSIGTDSGPMLWRVAYT